MIYPEVIAVNFGDDNSNGVYEQKGTHDGNPFYIKVGQSIETDSRIYLLIFHYQYGQYSYTPSWYIMEVTQIKVGDADPEATQSNPIKIYTPKYRSLTDGLFDNEWKALAGTTSGEQDTGLVIALESSSSSSSAEIDESSSSSEVEAFFIVDGGIRVVDGGIQVVNT